MYKRQTTTLCKQISFGSSHILLKKHRSTSSFKSFLFSSNMDPVGDHDLGIPDAGTCARPRQKAIAHFSCDCSLMYHCSLIFHCTCTICHFLTLHKAYALGDTDLILDSKASHKLGEPPRSPAKQKRKGYHEPRLKPPDAPKRFKRSVATLLEMCYRFQSLCLPLTHPACHL